MAKETTPIASPDDALDKVVAHISNITGDPLGASIIVAVGIIAITAVVSHIAVKTLRAFLLKEGNPLAHSSFYATCIRVAVWSIGISVTLDTCFHVNMSAVITALGVGGIAVSLGFQSTLTNIIAGASITLTKAVKPGDHIHLKNGDIKGVVQDITWAQTRLKNGEGHVVVIPNSVLASNPIVHLPSPNHVSVHITLPATDDVDQVVEELTKTASEAATALVSLQEPVKVSFGKATDLSLEGSITLQISDPSKASVVKDAITRAIAPLLNQARPTEE